MVGVPGKSKACQTCRRRRAKCDLVRPACGQCQRARLVCGGYERQLIFLNNEPREAKDGKSKFKQVQYSAPGTSKEALQAASPSPLTILARGTGCSATEQGIIGYFWSEYLPNGRATADEGAQQSFYGWSNVIQQMYTHHNIVRVALLAVGLNRMGQVKNDQAMIQMSHGLYGKTLLAVGRAVREPDRQPNHVTLSALKLLGSFELWSMRNRDSNADHWRAWATHIGGTAAFVLLRKPEDFIEGYAHQLFVDSRLAEAMVNIGLRKPAPFARPEWKTIPWTKIAKAPRDSLLDVMLEVPGLYAKIDQLQACDDTVAQPERAKLIAQTWALAREVELWREGLGRPSVDFGEEKIGTKGAYHPTPEEISTGLMALMYWGVCILLYDIIRSETKRCPSMAPVSWPESSDPLHYCWKMVGLVPYFVVDSSLADHFINKALSSLAIALNYLRKPENGRIPEANLQLLAVFNGEYGEIAGRFLSSWQSSEQTKAHPSMG